MTPSGDPRDRRAELNEVLATARLALASKAPAEPTTPLAPLRRSPERRGGRHG